MARPPVRSEDALLSGHERRIKLLERRISKTPAGLPARLGPEGQEVDDWNDAILPGFYWGTAAANQPIADDAGGTGWWSGTVTYHPGSGTTPRIFQEVREGRSARSGIVYRRFYDGTVWTAWQPADALRRGTAARRALTVSRYLELWLDTDGAGQLWCGNKTGGWRQYEGITAVGTKAWDTSGVSGAASIYARTDAVNVPTVLETNEYLRITPIALGTGYATLGVGSIVRNPTNTTVTTRLMQFLAATTQNYTYHWQICTY